jgi:hypothetical protein
MTSATTTILCNRCQKPITFDSKHVSQRTGKKIPLDVDTKEPHDCKALECSKPTKPEPSKAATTTEEK